MKCLSLWQPWASYLVCGEKKIETRHWPTKHRGRLLIHAAKTTQSCANGHIATMAFGAIIGIVDLVDCKRSEDLWDKISPWESHLGNYEDGRFGWMTENQHRFESPIPYRGQQGLFDVDTQLSTDGELMIYTTGGPVTAKVLDINQLGWDLTELEQKYNFKLSDYFKPGEMILRDAIAMVAQGWEPEKIRAYIKGKQDDLAQWIAPVDGGAE